MSSIHSHASIVQLNGELYVFGGGNGCIWYDKGVRSCLFFYLELMKFLSIFLSSIYVVESYIPILERWTLCPSLNQKKESLTEVSLNNKIFAVGGSNGVDCFSNVEMLDLHNGRWISIHSIQDKVKHISFMLYDSFVKLKDIYSGNIKWKIYIYIYV